MAYTITDLSKMFNLPASTIRYYEKIGLLENVEHKNSHRFYDDSHIDRLNAIECFKKALLPLDEIKLFFTYEKDMENNSEKILEMMRVQESKTIESLEALKAGLEHIQKKIYFYISSQEALFFLNRQVLQCQAPHLFFRSKDTSLQPLRFLSLKFLIDSSVPFGLLDLGNC